MGNMSGIHISAYSGLTKMKAINAINDIKSISNYINDKTDMLCLSPPKDQDLDIQLSDGINGVYAATDKFSFYIGDMQYYDWRGHLSKCIGYGTTNFYAAVPELSINKPFFNFLMLPDYNHFIGPDTSKEFFAEFITNHSHAVTWAGKTFNKIAHNDNFISLYRNFMLAFNVGSANGAVVVSTYI